MRTDNLNFRGKYKQYDPDGNSYVYKIGDSVEYKGKLFSAVQSNINKVPDTIESSNIWKSLGGVEGFYISENAPINSVIGDRWWKPSTSVMYTYVLENTNRFWVEL